MEIKARQKRCAYSKSIENKGFQLFIKNWIYVDYTYLIPTEFKKRTMPYFAAWFTAFFHQEHIPLDHLVDN